MRDSDDGLAPLDDPASLANRRRVRDRLEHMPASTDLTRLLAVEVLLAEPEALQDDCLESCLYVLRERLRGAGQS
jgi:hypothetical protein